MDCVGRQITNLSNKAFKFGKNKRLAKVLSYFALLFNRKVRAQVNTLQLHKVDKIVRNTFMDCTRKKPEIIIVLLKKHSKR